MGEYQFRAGTCDNLGFEYEDQMIAYLAVAACNQKDLKDFWIANNVDGLGAWDDIVLYTETISGQKSLQFLQLKHKQDLNRLLKFNEYKDEIKKYAKNFETIMSQINDQETQTVNIELLKRTKVPPADMEFILMTNGEFVNNSPNFSVSTKFKNLFIMTNTDGLIYDISARNNSYKNDINFKRQFTIISEQSGVINDGLLNNIVIQLEAFISRANFKYHLEVAKYLPTAIKEWFHTKKRTLTVADVKKMISSGILSALKHTKPIDNKSPTLDDGKWDIFRKLIKPFQLVVLANKPDLMLKNFFDTHDSYHIISCETADVGFVIDCIKADVDTKVIMFVPNEILDSIKETEIATLTLLNSLPVESLAPLNDFDIKIQGRQTKFGTLLHQYPDIKCLLNVGDIVHLLLGKFCINEGNNFLSYYVPRSIPRIFVEESIILQMFEFSFIVIVEDNLVETELKIKSSLQSKSNDAVFQKRTRLNDILLQCVNRDEISEAISEVERKSVGFQVLKYHKNNNHFKLEWLQSSANISEVKKFIDIGKCDEIKSIEDNLADLCLESLNKVLLVANPGMGKTYFSKNLANHYSIDCWVILVTLNEIDLSHINNFRLFLKYYSENLNPIDNKFFELYLRKKAIVMLFDGFDEVAHEYKEEALTLIKEAIEEKLKIIVTSREVTKEYLEKNLDTLAYTLNPFSNDEKIEFLGHFYVGNVKQIDGVGTDVIKIRIKEFAVNLLKNCSISNWDEEFTGVPLQCRLLAEGFMEDCQSYCEIGDENNIPKSLNLITLYETFIDKKMNIHFVEKGKVTSYLMKATNKLKNIYIKNHMTAAVQIIFPQVGTKISIEFLEEIKNAEEKNGIITRLDGNEKPVFIHRTFAEYFAAKWLVDIKEGKKQMDESKRGEYLSFLLKPEFNVVRDLFDRIVCKQCELHNAVLNADLPKVRDLLEKNANRDDAKCGRNASHLISARGARHERIEKKNREGAIEYWAIENIEEDKYLEILELVLENYVWIEEKDEVLRWTPQQYADDRNAFGTIDRLCGFNGSQLYNVEDSFMSKWNTEEVLRMCSTYDYLHLAKKVIQNQDLNAQQLTSMTLQLDWYSTENGTLLHVAAANGNAKILDVLLKYIDVNIRDNVGQTPLHVGCRIDGHVSAVKALMVNGSNLFLEDDIGGTPISNAVHYCHDRELIEYVTSYDLLKSGSDIDAKDSKGNTVVHMAVHEANIKYLELLLQHGANPNIENGERLTALGVARTHGRNKMFLAIWDRTQEDLIGERDVLHKLVVTEGHNLEVRKKTFDDYPEELAHLVDTMAEAGLYYYGVDSEVRCFSCDSFYPLWKPSDDPWVIHAKH